MEPAAVKGNPRALPTLSPAPARSCPLFRPCSQSVCWGARLAAQPASSRASQWLNETRRWATEQDPKLVFTSISLDRDNSRDWNLGLTILVLAVSCCGKLTMVETIRVMVTDTTLYNGSTSACLPHQIPHSPSHRLLADWFSQHGCRQVRDDQLAGKDRHTYRHKMTQVRPPVSLPSRLTESMVLGQDLAGAGLIVGRACGFPLTAAGSTYIAFTAHS